MNKAQKSALVNEFNDRFTRAAAVFLADYRGIKMGGMTELRRSLRESSIEFKIIKNTLARIAMKGTPVEALEEHFKDTVAIAFSYDDPAAAAKALTEFAKKEPNLKLIAASVENKVLGLVEIKALAALPSRDELLAMLVGTMGAVTTGFVRVLSGVQLKLIYALKAVAEAKGSDA